MNKMLRLSLQLGAAFFVLVSGLLLVDASAASSPPPPSGFVREGALLVTTLEDVVYTDGECSLREAIQAANTNLEVEDCGSGDVLTDTITFDVAGTITLTSQLSVTAGGPLVIDGGEVTTSGGGLEVIDGRLDLLNISVMKVGESPLINVGATVNISNSEFYENGGGGISNFGIMQISGCQIHDNYRGITNSGEIQSLSTAGKL